MRTGLGIALVGTLMLSWLAPTFGQPFPNKKYGQEDKFRQLEEILPTPNGYRSAAGEPGPDYWQQKIDYNIDVTLNDKDQSIQGSETIRYHNHSPHTLRYVWLQLDPNIFRPDSAANRSRSSRGGPGLSNRMSTMEFEALLLRKTFDGGCNIESVTDQKDNDLAKTIVDTMMRIDLGQPLAPGQDFTFKIRWNYKINNARLLNGRTGTSSLKRMATTFMKLPSGSHDLRPLRTLPVGSTNSIWGKESLRSNSVTTLFASPHQQTILWLQRAFSKTQPKF
jgi:hypothetical protein